MACQDCGPKTVGRCDVCFLVDGNAKFKPVVYCEECGAYICTDCNGDMLKRAKAAVKDTFIKIGKYFGLKTKPENHDIAMDTESTPKAHADDEKQQSNEENA